MNEATKKHVITGEMVWDRIPPRPADAHKGTCGSVLALCGCDAYRGAAALCSLGALRSGAGLVTLAAPERVITSVACRILEAVYLPLPDDAGLRQKCEKATVCAVGCGKPEDAATFREVDLILNSARGTVVLDAGGLCSLLHTGEENPPRAAARRLAGCPVPLILTPHVGEMARLTGRTVPEVSAEADGFALGYAEATGAVVLLKGHRTRIATPAGELFENRSGNAGLARGGSGDVLTGIIAGLAAQGLSPADAALCGAWLHGTAADACAERLSVMGMLPEDLLIDLGQLFLKNGR